MVFKVFALSLIIAVSGKDNDQSPYKFMGPLKLTSSSMMTPKNAPPYNRNQRPTAIFSFEPSSNSTPIPDNAVPAVPAPLTKRLSKARESISDHGDDEGVQVILAALNMNATNNIENEAPVALPQRSYDLYIDQKSSASGFDRFDNGDFFETSQGSYFREKPKSSPIKAYNSPYKPRPSMNTTANPKRTTTLPKASPYRNKYSQPDDYDYYYDYYYDDYPAVNHKEKKISNYPDSFYSLSPNGDISYKKPKYPTVTKAKLPSKSGRPSDFYPTYKAPPTSRKNRYRHVPTNTYGERYGRHRNRDYKRRSRPTPILKRKSPSTKTFRFNNRQSDYRRDRNQPTTSGTHRKTNYFGVDDEDEEYYDEDEYYYDDYYVPRPGSSSLRKSDSCKF